MARLASSDAAADRACWRFGRAPILIDRLDGGVADVESRPAHRPPGRRARPGRRGPRPSRLRGSASAPGSERSGGSRSRRGARREPRHRPRPRAASRRPPGRAPARNPPTRWRTGRSPRPAGRSGRRGSVRPHGSRPGRRHRRGRGGLAGTDLSPLADQHDAERCSGVEAMARQRPVAILEDVQRQDDAGAEHGVQRKERDLHRHQSVLEAWRPAGTDPSLAATTSAGSDRARCTQVTEKPPDSRRLR